LKKYFSDLLIIDLFHFIISIYEIFYFQLFLRGISKQATNGSPVKLGGHEHMGLWLIVSHLALEPHNVRQGSLHLYEMHARLKAHSALTVHSGRQFGGLATHWKSGKQVQTLVLFTIRHKLLGPHGDGSQGLLMALSPKIRLFYESITIAFRY